MEQKYRDWIDARYPTQQSAYGKCREATADMIAAFPELRLIRGHYYCLAGWGERTHWWCVAADGSVVDPTARQFPSGGRGEYVAWIEGDKEPTGQCPNCNEYVYDGGTCCSEKCHNQYAAYCNSSF